ncbi:hypothetical protein D020_1479A, partial [Vibrio parahaemolyticus SBR10290]
MLRT